ncbi:MAG: endonuclease/exonuclease/phosphatase family protein [Polyangiaceae bacterium]|nr:endonuclease/exonuclease/phosphatase family protein [Polyangiaceae bacterium]
MAVRFALSSLLFGAALGCAEDATSEGPDSGVGGRPPAEAQEVRIATFNARNLFNDRIDGEPGILDEAGSTPSTAVYQAKLRNTATLLAQLEAHVIVLQEIENRAVLDELAARSELGREYPHRYLVAGNDPRGIDVGLMSTLPIISQVSHRADLFPRTDLPDGPKYRYARDCIEVQLEVAGRSLHVLGVHFKAKSNDDPDKRLAEAQHTRLLADATLARDPEALVVVLGDFNDFPGSPPMNALDGAAPLLFTSAGRRLPNARAWTVESSSAPGGRALHDDLLTSPSLTGAYVNGSVHILHDAELSRELADLSDHAPVVASYYIEPPR